MCEDRENLGLQRHEVRAGESEALGLVARRLLFIAKTKLRGH